MSDLVSMGDVAKTVGVNCSTVSKVLAGKGGKGRIAPATQERIRVAARQLGYVPKPPVLLRRRMVVELPIVELSGETPPPTQDLVAVPEPDPAPAPVPPEPTPEPILELTPPTASEPVPVGTR